MTHLLRARLHGDCTGIARVWCSEQACGGAELVWTVGEYDVVILSEFASDEKATAAFLLLASAGNVRSRTLRAYTAAEMKEVIGLTGVVRMEHGSWG